MQRLIGFKISGPLWEAFEKADKLANKLGQQDIQVEFSMEEGVLDIMVKDDHFEAAQEALK